MGISSNQARFLALTSRQVDLEHRIQQICQRRLRLSSELENTATSYNNKISNRKLFTMNTADGGIKSLTAANITALQDENGNNFRLISKAKADDGKTYGDVSYSGGNLLLNMGHGETHTLSPTELGFDASASPTEEQLIEQALRIGIISIASYSDNYTQTSVILGNTSMLPMELKDWRTLPQLADELYKGDDVSAEDKYEKTISEINAQDKKLQLEQTSIEVEYKAITSEKESVKKVLDTNAQTSFKYFS